MKNKHWQTKPHLCVCIDRTKILSGLFFVLAAFLLIFSTKCFAEVMVQKEDTILAEAAGPAVVEEAKVEVPMVEKRTEGTVSAASKQGVAVEYASSGESVQEIWIDYGENVEVRGFADRSELKMGDVVAVVYGETPDKHRYAKEISMVRKAPEETEATEE